MSKTINKELKKVKLLMDCNILAINVDRTNSVLFHSHRMKLPDYLIPAMSPFTIGKQFVKKTKYVRFSGILLGENFSSKYKTNELCR